MSRDITLHCLKPGLQTLVQDAGRPDYQAQGVPAGGALDQTAARVANWLVGNAPEGPVLEITCLGPVLTISGPCQLALTGADLSARLNGQPVPRYQTVTVEAAATLTFGRLVAGCRAYLAVGGQWQVRRWLGSASALLHGGAPATPDSILARDSRVRIQPQQSIVPRKVAAELIPALPTHVRVRVLPGPEMDVFSALAIGYFFSRNYQLTPDVSRMGYRLRSPEPAELVPGREIISSGVVPGTVQITSAGQPVLLLADAQTTGGYCRLATVISADLDAVAQLKPGDTLAFALVSLAEAQAALLAQRQQWAML